MTREIIYPYFRGQGCFNRFLIFDLIRNPERFTKNFVHAAQELLNDLKFDDVLILLPAIETSYTVVARMEILEPDGSFADFCGNGARVVAAYFERFYYKAIAAFFKVTHAVNEHDITCITIESKDIS